MVKNIMLHDICPHMQSSLAAWVMAPVRAYRPPKRASWLFIGDQSPAEWVASTMFQRLLQALSLKDSQVLLVQRVADKSSSVYPAIRWYVQYQIQQAVILTDDVAQWQTQTANKGIWQNSRWLAIPDLAALHRDVQYKRLAWQRLQQCSLLARKNRLQ